MANRRTTPDEVQIRTSPREPVTDPTLGIEVPRGGGRRRPSTAWSPIGDSLTHGFMSARRPPHRPVLAGDRGVRARPDRRAVQLPDVRVADRTGRAAARPRAAGASVREAVRGPAGLLGDRDAPGCGCASYMDRIEDYWERGDGSQHPAGGAPFHNMAVYGWDLLDPQLLTSTMVAARLAPADQGRPAVAAGGAPPGPGRLAGPAARPQGQPRPHRPRRRGRHERTRPRAWRRWWSSWAPTTPSARSSRWSPRGHPTGYADLPLEERLAARVGCNLWRPSAFAADWALLEAKLRDGRGPARHRRDGPVGHHRADRPRHLQEGPAASRGTSPTTRGPGSPTTTSTPSATRTSPATRPARSTRPSTPTTRRSSTPSRPPAATASTGTCSTWASILDRLATRRYIDSPWARPAWWTPYELPPRAARAGPGAEHPVLPVRTGRAHGRRPVLPRRRAPDDDRLRHPRPGGHQGDGAGRRRVRRPRRAAPRAARCRSTSNGCCGPTP